MQTNPNINNRLIVQSIGTDGLKLTSIVPGLSFTTTPSVINGGGAGVGSMTGPFQADTMTIGSTVVAGEIYSVAVTDVLGAAIGTASYTAQALDTPADVQANLIAALQGAAGVGRVVAAGVNNEFDITASSTDKIDIIRKPNATFNPAPTATNLATLTTLGSTVTVGGTIAPGDIFTLDLKNA